MGSLSPQGGRTGVRRHIAGAVLLALVPALAACGSSGGTVKTSSILRADPAGRTVRLLLVASATSADGGFNFDGYGNGAMRVRVPVGWRVTVTCKNAASDLSHSCAIVTDVPIVPTGAPLAFPGSSTPRPRSGTPPGATTVFSFLASRVGTYRIACLVSGHEADGMWDWFQVTSGGVPSVRH
ncbi:MAG TPA: sulfocyanin-like copper-binding protein [Acidimicrobiales bacterium]|nr:sulfocyanin-like copper-binding protein [Acidimicrobiales bacterium]